ncbi:MAG: hypothetical protein V1724_01445 [Chloroflexota bacterium]
MPLHRIRQDCPGHSGRNSGTGIAWQPPPAGPGTKYIGKSIEKVDALERVTGKATFGADIHRPGMLQGKVLRSLHPHAWVKHVDTRKALALDGVKAVVTAADFPPIDTASGTIGGELPVNILNLRKMTLAHDKALYGHGAHPRGACPANPQRGAAGDGVYGELPHSAPSLTPIT